MAKGNMLLGYSRGSVGDVVMSRVKGQQVAKARNRKPANPKSNKQMKQRSSFISPVKFFTHGVQAFFNFAFSDKKVTESDFNAFMRHNSKLAFPVTKDEHDSVGFPALGNYMMTKGKLPELPVVNVTPGSNSVGLLLGEEGDITSIAQLSARFVQLGYADEGDIITIVSIHEHVAFMSNNELIVGYGNSPFWSIDQFVVDSSNPALIADELPDVLIANVSASSWLFTAGYNGNESTDLHSLAIVRSKETARGLEVSTAYLQNGGYIDDYITYRNQKAQVDKVLADWGATGDAILQGSIAKK